MRKWFEQNKTIAILFFLALIPRLIFMLIAYFIFGDHNFIRGTDGYLDAGLNLLTSGVFGSGEAFSVAAHSFPAPGYPIILAISWLIIPKYIFIVFWQNIIYSIFVVLIYKFARLFFNNFIALGAAVFMALEPFSIFWPNVVMSETPFLLFFMLSIYYLALFWQREKYKFIIYSSVLLGLAALVRPIVSYFYPVVVIITVVMMWNKVRWSKLAKYLVIFLIIFLSVTAPWCIRNKIQFDTYTISNLPHYLYFSTVTRDFLILEKGFSFDEAESFLENLAVERAGVENFSDIVFVDKYLPIFKDITYSIIGTQPFAYLKWHLIKGLPIFTNSGWMNILSFLNVDLGQAHSVNLSALLIQRNWQGLVPIMKENPLFSVRLFGVGSWILIDIVALFGLVLMLLKRDLFKIGLVMLIIIGYFVFASSWGAMARMRLPIQPFLFIFFIYAVYRGYLKYFLKTI